MNNCDPPANVASTAGLGVLVERLRLIVAWHTPAGPTPNQKCPRKDEVCAEAANEIERLRDALAELRDRIKAHPAYADLTEEEEMETGGDTAELSYLVRLANEALDA
jgi:hypothetical protein